MIRSRVMRRALPKALSAAALPAALAAAVALSGCAVLATPDPVQLYRFGGAAAFAATPDAGRAGCEPVSLSLRRVDFPDASGGDRLLAVTGAETAYIKGARWVSPASTLFEESLRNAFVDGAACARLGTGPFTRGGMVLGVDVRRFEAVYPAEGAAPQVNLVVMLRLVSPGDREVVAEERIAVVEDAGTNRVSAIVDAFDRASAEANRRIVVWADQTATAAAARKP